MSDLNVFPVCVRCFTFNHAPFIKNAMDGFCMQHTTFPFVCVIVDDASTDGEQDVISSFLSEHFNLDDDTVVRKEETDDYILTFARHNTNENCFFAVYNLKYNHYSIKKDKFSYFSEFHDYANYVALCEGDDYWIDPLKLQKQVDYLESHPDCSLVHTRFNYLYVNKNQIKDDSVANNNILSYGEGNDSIAFGILNDNHYRIQTATILFNRLKFDKIRSFETEERGLFLMGDTQLWMSLLSVGYIHYIPEVTTVYRIMEESSTRSKSMAKRLRFALSAAEMRYFYACKYGLDKEFFYKKYLKFLYSYLMFDKQYETNSRIVTKKNTRIKSVIVNNSWLRALGRSFLTFYFNLR